MQWVILALFAVTFTWIAASFWTAVAGFLLQAFRRDPLSLRRLHAEDGTFGCLEPGRRTAIVMPVYNEDPVRVTRGIEAICRSLLATGQGGKFDFWVLSDSSDPTVIGAEERALRRLRARLGDGVRLRYRRRQENRGRKAGNIADFCERWGAEYEYMVVLDADSLIEGPTLVRLVQTMDANPNAGLIQTLPLPVRQQTLFGRFQQFANAVHGPMLATGLAFWQANSANYWGHNAIIRIRPFREHCQLPVLPGRPPLGGEILSHDFVEASFLRRAGWDLWLLPQLPGSFEELPGNLVDFARRDRRWIQGNLQHLRLLAEPGLHPLNRAHFLFGAVSYLVSVFWLLMLAAATVVALGVPASPSGGPLGGEGASLSTAYALLGGTLMLLLLPKALGVLLVAARDPGRFGGRGRLVLGGVLETLYSVLIAPLMMAFHAVFVAGVLSGRNVIWSAQPREGRMVAWSEALRRTGPMVAAALAWATLLAVLAPAFLWWVLPVLVGWLAAPALVRGSGSRAASARLRVRGLLLTPADITPGPALATMVRLEEQPAQAGGVSVLLRGMRRMPPAPGRAWAGGALRKAASGN
ncbi:glucosyl transferase family 2 [Thioalkalivibrio paradoxus ARh 1]|uniref:Glucans biosynthesis glucosyltransferase H n=1 Tax=Thioalkalivibrio paradoxus ARh 1 TaxID=713585 RepID=W0DMM4_9GAMM|nr:glucosyl transferase family 2 [Thioalkalivibrio paradoxus ARh 1]